MTSSTYALTTFNPYLTHGLIPTWFLRDRSEDSKEELRAQIHSGDYFVTLATILDDISDALWRQTPGEAEELQLIVDELLYLQSEYKIVKK